MEEKKGMEEGKGEGRKGREGKKKGRSRDGTTPNIKAGYGPVGVILLRFDCNSTTLRPFDDRYYTIKAL